MADDFIRFAFTGGVFSRSLIGRTDVDKYDLGLAEAENWFIHYQGGASTRQGLTFLDYIQDDDLGLRIAEFKFSSRLADVYLLVFSKNRIRFMQNGAYVLETIQAVEGVSVSDVITITGHGFSNGDWVKMEGVSGPGTYEVQNVTANTFKLKNPDGTSFIFDGMGGFLSGISRIYTVSTPYNESILSELLFSQTRNEVIITHLDYAPRRLTRIAATNWTLALVDFEGNTVSPGALTITPETAGTSGVVYGITGVDISGAESYITNFTLTELTNNFTSTAGSVELTWPTLAGVKYYKIYRSIVYPVGTQATLAQELGYIGQTKAPRFVDANIVPDFTQPPPTQYDPFAKGRILGIDITAVGSGYDKSTATVTVSGGSGTGFLGKPVVNAAGEIIGVLIINPGVDYESPTVSFGGGTGATATATAGAMTGTFPRCSTLLQQRRVYAGTDNQPMTLFGSRPGFPDNFSYSFYGSDADSFELELDAPDVNPIRFCLSFPAGLIAFTESAVHIIKGAEGKVLSPLTGITEPIAGTGSAAVPPLYIEDEVLYLSSTGTEVRLLRPDPQGNVAKTQNVSLYSSDFFSKQNIVQSWAFAKDPYKLLWANRLDGTFLSLTYMPDQNVFAWSNHATKGQVCQVQALNERGRDRVYMIVKRKINGTWRKYLERLALREPENVEYMMAVDCGLQTSRTYPNATLSIDDVNITTSADVFSAGDVGSHIRAAKGRALILTYVGPRAVTVAWQIAPKEFIPLTEEFFDYVSGDWSLDAPFTTLAGLDHLEGQTVQVFADGNVQTEQVVTDGAITLDAPASFVTVGIGFTATLKTLPLYASDLILAAKAKRVVGAAIRLLDSRGISVGDDTTLYEMKDRTFETFDEPTHFQSGIKEIAISSSWDFDGSITVKKTGPLNATLVGLILKAEKSDD